MFTFIKHGRKISVTRHMGTAKYFPIAATIVEAVTDSMSSKDQLIQTSFSARQEGLSNFFQMHLCSRNIKFSGKMHTSTTFIKSTRASAHFSSSTRHCWLNDDSTIKKSLTRMEIFLRSAREKFNTTDLLLFPAFL